jgi:lipopolysaccharide transport system permease protein
LNATDHNRVIEIRPSASLVRIDVRDLWAHRELLYFLTLREIKVRYKQTAIGVLWVVLQPVLTAALLSLIFATFARFETVTVPYVLFALSGIIVWSFVQSAVTTTSGSFVSNTNLVTKVYFPRLIVPLASTLAAGFDLLVSLPILAAGMAYFGIIPGRTLVLAPLFLMLALIAAGALGILFSSLNVRFRDVKFAIPFFLQVWMFASPIIYPASIIPEKWRYLFAVNPLVGVVEGWRASLFGTPIDWSLMGISCASIATIVLVSLLVFRRMEDDFADHI